MGVSFFISHIEMNPTINDNDFKPSIYCDYCHKLSPINESNSDKKTQQKMSEGSVFIKFEGECGQPELESEYVIPITVLEQIGYSITQLKKSSFGT